MQKKLQVNYPSYLTPLLKNRCNFLTLLSKNYISIVLVTALHLVCSETWISISLNCVKKNYQSIILFIMTDLLYISFK